MDPAELHPDATDLRALPTPLPERPLSVTDLFSIGIGPSSSHTVGPMKAALAFARGLVRLGEPVDRVTAELYGSLGATGRGHGTDRAIVWGLAGHHPRTCPPEVIAHLVDDVAATGILDLAGELPVPFDIARDIRFLPRTVLPQHVNGLRLAAHHGEDLVLERTYFSIGGGFVTRLDGTTTRPLDDDGGGGAVVDSPHSFRHGEDLLARCAEAGLGVAALVRESEEAARSREELDGYLDAIWEAMDACIAAGLEGDGELPGGLRVRRRAGKLHRDLLGREAAARGMDEGAGATGGGVPFTRDPFVVMDWVNLFALAVNEENASGHRVVTAPTNGAAGVIPAVIKYYLSFIPGASRDGVRRFLLAATAIGAIIKTNASIAGAEVGCQGEVGSASAMAAAGLAEVMGGTPAQVENAAEIAMEHNLGLTCDPIGGLVQIPCIERNAVAAVNSINAARIALWGDGQHTVSLDAVVETMRQTGVDMMSKYKETALGGLAVNVVEC
ncbi:MAG: L-serine ammonia-lyase [Actinomycetota bacterium]